MLIEVGALRRRCGVGSSRRTTTYIAGNKIYCEEPISIAHQKSTLLRRANLFSPITRQDLISYLERLSVAAELVESRASRTRTTAQVTSTNDRLYESVNKATK